MLKDEFNNILRDYGHNVLVVRQESKLKCSCWHEKTQSSDKSCPVCFGIGTVPIIEKHTVRALTVTIPQTLPRAVTDSSFGSLAMSGKAYFFKEDVKISLQDLVIEVDWSPTGKPIYAGGEISEINYIDKNRFERGEIAFQKAYVAGESVDRNVRGIRIANMNGIKNYEIVRDGGE